MSLTDEPDVIDGKVEARAKLFEDMAAQIRLNRDAKFGGALLAVPPGDGQTFSFITFNQDEAAIFWGVVETLAQVAKNTMEQAQRQQGFGRR